MSGQRTSIAASTRKEAQVVPSPENRNTRYQPGKLFQHTTANNSLVLPNTQAKMDPSTLNFLKDGKPCGLQSRGETNTDGIT